MRNSIYSLQRAINNWDVGREFIDDLNTMLSQITLEDIEKLFEEVPSYWAIGEGYYYAVENMDGFVDSLVELLESKLDESGQPIRTFTAQEVEDLKDRLYSNDPQANEFI